MYLFTFETAICLHIIHQNCFYFYFFSEIDKLNEESVKTLDDIKGLQEYLEKRQKYFTSKQVELKGVSENVKKLNDRMGMSAVCLFFVFTFFCVYNFYLFTFFQNN